MNAPPFHLRLYEPEQDFNFVRNAWFLSGLVCSKKLLEHAFRKEIYDEVTPPLVAQLLETSETIIACDSSNRDVILGFACGLPDRWSAPVLHFVYVKHELRDFNIAPQCLAAIGVHRKTRVICTTWNEWCDSENRKRSAAKEPLMRFNPYFVGVNNAWPRETEPKTVSDAENATTDSSGWGSSIVSRSWLDR